MPGNNGTGPKGEGPMTGRGMGYCILKKDLENPSHIEGFAGIDLKPVNSSLKDKKEVIDMPAGDGTGPSGLGPMTGRAAGYCAGYAVPGYMNPISGRNFYGVGRGGYPRGGGRGRAWGGGSGWGSRGVGYQFPYSYYPNLNYPAPVYPYAPQITSQDKANFLKDNISFLEKEIKADKERIKELEIQKQETKKG